MSSENLPVAPADAVTKRLNELVELIPVSPAEAVTNRLNELNVVLDEEIHYRLESVFPKIDGWGSNGEIKRRVKLIRFVEPTLYQILLKGEEVLYVAKGVQYSLAENYLMGALWATMINQTVFVLTNARLLMMRTNGNGKPKETFWMIYYSEIEDFKAPWTGMIKLKLKDKKTFTFTGFPSIDRKTMPSIFQNAMNEYRRLNLSPKVSQSRENLCCHCFKVVPKGEYGCEQCGTEYWTPRELALRSLLFPSWGDICMKHYGLAFFELAGYFISWAYAIVLIREKHPGAWLVVAWIFLIEHTVDALLTYSVANKGLNHRRDPGPNRVNYGIGAVNADWENEGEASSE
jgi:hypothetical protein